jgi:uncharacterized protein (TIGR03066 family)
MSIRAATLVGFLFALSTAVAADEKKVDPKSDQQLLVGTWKLVKTSQGDLPEGVEVLFEPQKDGKFKLTMSQGGEKDVNAGTWKLDMKKLALEFTEGSRKGAKQTDTVKELTEKKLVLEEANENVEDWERVPPKKGDK